MSKRGKKKIGQDKKIATSEKKDRYRCIFSQIHQSNDAVNRNSD